jgi:hypothetical protein
MPNTNTATDTVITLAITVSETNTVLAGLNELPAKFSVALMEKIKVQAEAELARQQAFLAQDAEATGSKSSSASGA